MDIVGAGEIVAHEQSNREPNHINDDVDKTNGHRRSFIFFTHILKSSKHVRGDL